MSTTPKKVVISPAKSVAPLAPRAVSVSVPNPTAPLSTLPPVAALATPPAPAPPTKKAFGDTLFGQIFNNSGGLQGIATAAATVVGSVKGTPATAIDPATGQVYTTDGLTPPEPEGDGTILGLPPLAFAAVVLLLLLGVGVLIHRARRG